MVAYPERLAGLCQACVRSNAGCQRLLSRELRVRGGSISARRRSAQDDPGATFDLLHSGRSGYKGSYSRHRAY